MEHDFCPCASCASQARALRQMAEAAEAEHQRQKEADDRSYKNNADLMKSGFLYWARKDYREFMNGELA